MSPEAITIRRSTPADRAALARLAALDSRRLPTGDLVLAQSEGVLRAAAPLAGGEALADPFVPTAALVALLEVRAAQLAPDGAGAPRGGLVRRLARAAGDGRTSAVRSARRPRTAAARAV